MTYALKTSLYFILGILGLGTAIIIGASALTFPFTSSLLFLGLLLVVTGWYRVFHNYPPHKRLALILGLATLAAVFIIPFSAVIFGLPLALGYSTILLGLLTIPPFIAIGLRGDVISFNESRKREKDIEEDTVLNTPLLSVPVNPKDVVSLPKEDFEDMLKPFNVTSKNVEDYSKVPVTEISRDGDVATYRVDDPEFNQIIKDQVLKGVSIDTDKLGTIEQGITSRTLTAKDFDYTPQKHIFFGASLIPLFNSDTHLDLYPVPQNLKATGIKVGQHISFVNDEEDGTQTFPQGTVTYVERDTLEGVPSFGKIIFELDNDPNLFVTDSDDEVFRLMGHLEDGPAPETEPLPAVEPIEKMLADAAEATDIVLEDTPTKPRTTFPKDPFTEVLEEALTGPLPETTIDPSYVTMKVSSIDIDPTDPKWKGTLTPETFIKFRKVQPGQTIRFHEEDKHRIEDAREVTGTVTHVKTIDGTDNLLMDITIDGPDAGTYAVISDHNAVLLDAIGKERVNV